MSKEEYWRKAEKHETLTFLRLDLQGWDHKLSNKLIVYLTAMQRLLPDDYWKRHSLSHLADTIFYG